MCKASRAHWGITTFPQRSKRILSSFETWSESHASKGKAPNSFHCLEASYCIRSASMRYMSSKESQPAKLPIIKFTLVLKMEFAPGGQQKDPFSHDLIMEETNIWKQCLQVFETLMFEGRAWTWIPTIRPETVVQRTWKLRRASSCAAPNLTTNLFLSETPEAKQKSCLKNIRHHVFHALWKEMFDILQENEFPEPNNKEPTTTTLSKNSFIEVCLQTAHQFSHIETYWQQFRASGKSSHSSAIRNIFCTMMDRCPFRPRHCPAWETSSVCGGAKTQF